MSDKEMENIENQKNSEKTTDGFESMVPDFSFSVSGKQITIKITPIANAERYEVWQSEIGRGEFSLVASEPSPVIEFYTADDKSCYCKVRALYGEGTEKIYTRYSKPMLVDMVTAAKLRDENLKEFFKSIKGIGDSLSYEDLDIALESLKLASLEVREKEERRKQELEAEKIKKELEEQNKRRQAAAKRAAALREKKRIEHIESVTRMDLPIDFVNAYADDERASEHCETMADALMMSLDIKSQTACRYVHIS